jgi:hypothetical protein
MYFALQILKHLLALCESKTEHTAFTEPTAEPVEPADGVADPVEVTRHPPCSASPAPPRPPR